MQQLTVVMLNWARPANVSRLLRHYAVMDIVREVIVFDNSGELHSDSWLVGLGIGKLRFIKSATDLGLATRFAAAGLARTSAVLIVDDDIELPAETVTTLYESWREQPLACHGLFGRNPGSQYTPTTVWGRCDVVLTRAVIVQRSLCCIALDETIRMANELGGEPYGNGEDIVLSFCTMRANRWRVVNCAYKLPYHDIDATDKHSISVRYSQHHEHRTRVVAWCRANITQGDRNG